jgi:hypothetical protein
VEEEEKGGKTEQEASHDSERGGRTREEVWPVE